MNRTTNQENATEAASPNERLVMCDGSIITKDELEAVYDSHDIAWMTKTKKYPPTALQLTIAFGKYATGTRKGDEMWCNYDQDALDYSRSTFHS